MYKFIDEKGEHLHLLNDKPLIGTTSVCGVIAKPLTWWASGLACAEFGWIKKLDTRKKPTEEEFKKNCIDRELSALKMLEKFSGMKPDEYVSLLDTAYAAHSKSLNKSADKGIDMHAELEKYILDCIAFEGLPMIYEGSVPQVGIFSAWAIENVKMFLVAEGHCYSERLWVGGGFDCLAELIDGSIVVIDFKSSKEAYISQFIQCALYDIQISENGVFDKDGASVYDLEHPIGAYIVFPFGAEKVEPCYNYDIESLKKGAEAAVVLYKLINA